MKRIGLTGNIGTGKSTVARVFEILKIPVYHADIQARTFLNSDEVKKQIASIFGNHLISTEGSIDRKALASIVFNDDAKLASLNNIIHPLVEADFMNWCENFRDQAYVLHEAAILFESGFDRLFDANILVTAPIELCTARVMARDGVTAEMVAQRRLHQWPQEKKEAMADHIIVNDENAMIIPQVLSVHKLISAS